MASPNIAEFILSQHQALGTLLNQYDAENDSAKKLTTATSILDELSNQFEIESKVLYPTLNELGNPINLNHETVKFFEVAKELKATDAKESDEFASKMKALFEGARAHFANFDSTMLPLLREKLEPARMEELGKQAMEIKASNESMRTSSEPIASASEPIADATEPEKMAAEPKLTSETENVAASGTTDAPIASAEMTASENAETAATAEKTDTPKTKATAAEDKEAAPAEEAAEVEKKGTKRTKKNGKNDPRKKVAA